jgi:acetoin utilization deacetylase AcuC-like enzyme
VRGRLADFKPDLIVMSAGFDAHQQDTMNYGLVSLSEDDYYWVTDRLRSVSQLCGKGRVVSVLEGGYRVKAGVSSALARSVAAHVRALCKPAPAPYVQGESNLQALERVLEEVAEHKERLFAAADGAGSRRKRRRVQVDYAALDEQSRKKAA